MGNPPGKPPIPNIPLPSASDDVPDDDLDAIDAPAPPPPAAELLGTGARLDLNLNADCTPAPPELAVADEAGLAPAPGAVVEETVFHLGLLAFTVASLSLAKPEWLLLSAKVEVFPPKPPFPIFNCFVADRNMSSFEIGGTSSGGDVGAVDGVGARELLADEDAAPVL